VIYISSEGLGDLKFRIMAWEQNRNTDANPSPFFLIRESINFMRGEDVGRLLATVEAIQAKAGVPIAAVFVDTVSRVLPGAEENLQKDMTLFIAACDNVRQRFACTVFGIHHTSRNGNMRGSTVMPGAADFIIEVRREPGAMAGSIFAFKIKGAEDGWEQNFKVEQITLADIAGNTSLVVDAVEVAPKKQPGLGWPDIDICRQILAAIDEQWQAGKPWCFARNSARSAMTNIIKRWRLNRDKENHVKGYRKLVEI
jgi:AAA domain